MADMAAGSIWLGSMPGPIICCIICCISGGMPSIPGIPDMEAAPPGMPPIIIICMSSIIFLLFAAMASWLYSPRTVSCFAAYRAQVNSSKP